MTTTTHIYPPLAKIIAEYIGDYYFFSGLEFLILFIQRGKHQIRISFYTNPPCSLFQKALLRNSQNCSERLPLQGEGGRQAGWGDQNNILTYNFFCFRHFFVKISYIFYPPIRPIGHLPPEGEGVLSNILIYATTLFEKGEKRFVF